jgi:hypothetical protein
MKPHEQCKAAGLDSLAELSKITGVSVNTLINWHKNKPKLFEAVLYGAVFVRYYKNKGE